MSSGDRLILAIEASNPSAMKGSAGGVALARVGDAVPLGVKSIEPTRRHDDALMPAVAALFNDCGVSRRDLRRVAVSIGPGGFTGLRVSVTTAKMIAEAVGASVVATPSALVAACAAAIDPPFAVALASKGETAWITIFDAARDAWAGADGELMDAAALEAARQVRPFRSLIADEHLPAPMRSWAESAGVVIEPLALDAESCLRASLDLPDADAAALAPLYPREPEAVTRWRALRARS